MHVACICRERRIYGISYDRQLVTYLGTCTFTCADITTLYTPPDFCCPPLRRYTGTYIRTSYSKVCA